MFICGGHPAPLVFSNEFDHFMDIHSENIVNFPPIGVIPSRKDIDAAMSKSILGYKQVYQVNQIELMGNGDIMLLYTDGLSELENSKGENFSPVQLEKVLKENKSLPAKDICSAIREKIFKFSDNLQDDITYVIIKKGVAHPA